MTEMINKESWHKYCQSPCQGRACPGFVRCADIWIAAEQAMIEREKDKKCSECKHCKEYESLPFCDSLGTLIQSDFYCKNYEKKGE
jgi:hypothetical protein